MENKRATIGQALPHVFVASLLVGILSFLGGYYISFEYAIQYNHNYVSREEYESCQDRVVYLKDVVEKQNQILEKIRKQAEELRALGILALFFGL